MNAHFDLADVVGEGIRVLKRLSAPGTRLEKRQQFYALTGTGRAGRALHVPPALVDAFRRRDWLSPLPGEDALRLSDAGLGWLRRALAGEDPYREQHAMLAPTEIAEESGERVNVVVDDGESPLARLHSMQTDAGKKLIDDVQFLAGERFRRDFTLASLMPRLVADLEAPVVAGRRGAAHGEFSDITVAARQRFSRAVEAMGPDLSGIAIDVCCHLKELNATGAGWPDNAALVVLRLALDRLAQHYGFTTRVRARTRVWRAPDDEENAGAKKAARDP